MPVHLTADVGSAGGLQVSHPAPSRADIQGPGPGQPARPPAQRACRGRDLPSSPLCASRKDSFFNIPRSHSKGLGRREAEEELEAQVSFLQGQLNDLEAMCKFCAKMMNVHIGKIQEVILQENLDKEDEVLVSLAGLKQIKDILKGSLRFNQSQLEAEENEEITIADDHYCSTAQQGLERNGLQDEAETDCPQPLPDPQIALPDPQVALPDPQIALPDPQVLGALGSEGRSWDDYILVSQDDDTPPQREENRAGPPQGGGAGRGRGAEQEGLFQDPLTGAWPLSQGAGLGAPAQKTMARTQTSLWSRRLTCERPLVAPSSSAAVCTEY
ncbi:hypothetical protein COCON_G00124980 [Conger conger]|uniref:Uncharacterized protein n=1 Tax=Conger conger TaxID=82655 RepID=A0A9Q1HWK4_CONCO|nr:hypothetical protein COCON_G00124980 [Conger conger]